jgi:hypothetical protein
MLHWRAPKISRRLAIAVLTPRGTVRTRKKPGRWSGNYPPGSPVDWLAEDPLLLPAILAGRPAQLAPSGAINLLFNRIFLSGAVEPLRGLFRHKVGRGF